ncbi:MAG TPA: VIT domain-containing protein [Thermoanaerobaculia bacterium]|nr:VIT domain-containing protein [Thermoanaerobaculia bacterium]
MQSLARSLSLTAALALATIVCLLAGAAPQTAPVPQPAKPAFRPIPKPAPAPEPQPSTSAPPISFSDPDGQELTLEDLQIRTAIHGMLALTEIELRFRNPQSRRIEGRFSCTLPPNAAISRFAKEVNGALMEGEVVERLRANQVYEQFLHQMRDPALLEQDQGNRFSARIFPIDPNAPVRLILSYSALLPLRDGVRTYSLPLRGISKVKHLTFRAFVTALPGEESTDNAKSSGITGLEGASRSTAEVISFEENDTVPQRDVVLSWRPTSSAARNRVLRAGDFYVASFRPQVTERSAPAPHDWLFYVDTSASSAEGAEHRIRALEQLLGALPPSDRVQLVAFDQDLAPLANGTASDVSRRLPDLLRTRLFLGGTDINALLADVARAARDNPSRGIVIASDLVATLGATESNTLATAARAIPAGTTLHALILGSREEAAFAKALTAGRGRVIRVSFNESLDANVRDAAAALRRPLGASFDVSDPAAAWIYPTHFDDVAAGDEILVLGKTRAASDPAPRLNSGGAATTTEATSLASGMFGPLLEREAYRAYLEYLADREANEPSEAVRKALATEQVKISTEQRVVIPRTTMLVLESEWDYQRFGLDRRALAAILTIDAGGIARIDRLSNEVQPIVRPVMPPPPPLPVTQTRREKTAPASAVVGNVQGQAAAAPEAITVQAEAPEELAKERDASAADAPQRMTDMVATSEARAQMAPPVASPAPVPPPPPPPALARPTPRPEPEAKHNGEWWVLQRPTRAQVEELERKLRDDPHDRERYNQLSEAYAALSLWSELRALALRWQPYDAENPQVYEVLGMADERLGNESEAARAHASLIEVAPGKTEILQRAGLLLLRDGRARLAETPLRHALELRPDRANSYRHLALMLWRDGRIEEAARVLESATRQQFPGWYGNVQRVLREELGYVYRAWLAKEPSKRSEIEQRAREYDVDLTRNDALRVTLAWETDANDVDLHVVDPTGEEAFYGHKETRSGLQLYEDITQGLGPEVIRTKELQRGTYHVGVRYFAAGPMGVSRGIVVIMRGDDVRIEPFRLVQGGGEIRYVAAVNVK